MESVIRSVDAAVVPLHGLRTVRDARRPFYEKGLGNAEVFEWKGGAYALHNKATSEANVLVDFGQGNVLTLEPGCTVRLFAEFWRLRNGAGASTVVLSLVPGAEFDANALAASAAAGSAAAVLGWTQLSTLNLKAWLDANPDGITTTFKGNVYTDSAGALQMERSNGNPTGVVDLTAFPGYSEFFFGAFWIGANGTFGGGGSAASMGLTVKSHAHPAFSPSEPAFGGSYLKADTLAAAAANAQGGIHFGAGTFNTSNFPASAWVPSFVAQFAASGAAVFYVSKGAVVLWGRP